MKIWNSVDSSTHRRRARLILCPVSAAACEEGPGVCSCLLTLVSLLMVLATLPLSLLFTIKVNCVKIVLKSCFVVKITRTYRRFNRYRNFVQVHPPIFNIVSIFSAQTQAKCNSWGSFQKFRKLTIWTQEF